MTFDEVAEPLPTRWDKIRAVQRMQRHLEVHLAENIPMAALAREAHDSPRDEVPCRWNSEVQRISKSQRHGTSRTAHPEDR